MVHAANIVTYNMADDDESFNNEMQSDRLEWNVSHAVSKQEDQCSCLELIFAH
jgi:hypothetical protein